MKKMTPLLLFALLLPACEDDNGNTSGSMNIPGESPRLEGNTEQAMPGNQATTLQEEPAKTSEEDVKNSLVRFVCQQYIQPQRHSPVRRLVNRVVIVEQLTMYEFISRGKMGSQIIDGSAMIDAEAENQTKRAGFLMRIYTDVSLVFDERTQGIYRSEPVFYGETKEEVIEQLLKRPASKKYGNGPPMEYVGTGRRDHSNFTFKSIARLNRNGSYENYRGTRYMTIDLESLAYDGINQPAVVGNHDDGWDNSWTSENGTYKCEKPVLIPVTEEMRKKWEPFIEEQS